MLPKNNNACTFNWMELFGIEVSYDCNVLQNHNNRHRFWAFAPALLTLVLAGCAGPSSSASPNSDQSAPIEPSPSTSAKFGRYTIAFSGLCQAPDTLYEIIEDSELIDLGLLAPSDIELSMRELGTSLRYSANWAKQDEAEYGPIPDPKLISDFKSKGEQVLKLRLALLRGDHVGISTLISEIQNLFERGKMVCDWRDQNSK